MKKLSYLLLITAMLVSSCSQDESIPEEEVLTEEQEILKYINENRTIGYTKVEWKDGSKHEEFISTKTLNLPELSWDNYLYEAARIQSEHMFETGLCEHTWLDGTDLIARIKMADCNYFQSTENICSGYHNYKDAINGWMNSEGHRNNILDKQYNIVAVSYKDKYWTMVLAYKPPE